MSIVSEPFGSTRDGRPVQRITLANRGGRIAKVMTYGAILTELHLPDRSGALGNIVLGFDNLAQYEAGHPYFGATVGRVGNRIAKGRFTLGRKTYTLATNNGPNHLHGGIKGFDKVVWTAVPLDTEAGPAVEFSYTSPDGEEGYPGTLRATVRYTLTDANELRLDYHATTDKPTPVNLTHHSYFNLAGAGNGTILEHLVRIDADHYLPVDAGLIPTGQIAPVAGTPMDFRRPQPVGSRIANVPGGYDHNYVLNSGGGALAMAAHVEAPSTGRVMEVLTTEPGVQFYTGNFLDGSIHGLGGTYVKHGGLCLETQHFPDSVNQPGFPGIILAPGQVYSQRTIYRFA